MHSTWESVAEQTGIFAGKGGFDVTAGGHTQLDGAVISSTATADKNRHDTGTLGYAQSELAKNIDLKGINTKYRYEFNASLSVIGSFSYLSGDKSYNFDDESVVLDEKDKAKLWTLMAGPAWRVNDYISIIRGGYRLALAI